MKSVKKLNEAKVKETIEKCLDRIKEAHKQAEEGERLSIHNGKLAVKAAIKAGANLASVKEMLPHGDYEKWMETNLGFSKETAGRYVRLAKKAGLKSFKDKIPECETLRQAYMLVGVLKETTGKKNGNGKKAKGEVKGPAKKSLALWMPEKKKYVSLTPRALLWSRVSGEEADWFYQATTPIVAWRERYEAEHPASRVDDANKGVAVDMGEKTGVEEKSLAE